MAKMIRIQFLEEGTAENPFTTRLWGFVPRVGESVLLPETGGVYQVTAVRWQCLPGEGAVHDDEPMVMITIEPRARPA